MLWWALVGAWQIGCVSLECLEKYHTDPRAKALLFWVALPAAVAKQFLLQLDVPTWWVPFADIEHWAFVKSDEWEAAP